MEHNIRQGELDKITNVTVKTKDVMMMIMTIRMRRTRKMTMMMIDKT